MCTGLCHHKYNTNLFDPAESESAHHRLPLVCDPALVRATQLDILKLQNHPTENIQSRVQPIEIIDIECVLGNLAGTQIEKKIALINPPCWICPRSGLCELQWGEFNLPL